MAVEWEFMGFYPLVMTEIAMDNGHRNSEFSYEKIVIFHSDVKLPEGTLRCHQAWQAGKSTET